MRSATGRYGDRLIPAGPVGCPHATFTPARLALKQAAGASRWASAQVAHPLATRTARPAGTPEPIPGPRCELGPLPAGAHVLRR